MVRSLVSVGIAVMACGWSVMAEVIQIDASSNLSNTTNTPPPNYYNSSNNNVVIRNLDYEASSSAPLVTISDIKFYSQPSTPPQPPLVPPKTLFQAASLSSRTFVVTGRRGSTIFYGLLEGGPERKSGSVRLVLNRAGRGSASVRVNGSTKRVVIPIKVDPEGKVVPITRDAAPGVSVEGKLTEFSDGTIGFDAAVTSEGQRTPVRLLRAAVPSEVAEAIKGRYTLLFENNTSGVMLYPGMTGFGMLQINKRGYVFFTGRLSDGSNFSQGTQLNIAGKWLVSCTAGTGAVLSGSVGFSDASESDCNGLLQWERQFSGQVMLKQTASVSLRGSRYLPELEFGSASQWTFNARNATGVPQTSSNLTPKPNNPLRLTATAGSQSQLTLNKGNGKLSGSILPPGSTTPQKAIGVFFQKTDEGFGLIKPTPMRAPSATVIGMPSWSGKFTLSASGSN